MFFSLNIEPRRGSLYMTLLDLFPGFMNLVLVVSLAGSPDRPHFLLGIIIPTTITVINNSWY